MSGMAGKIVLITGSSDGIGKETARHLAAKGAHVVMCARRPEPLLQAADEIRAEGGSAEAHPLDVSDLDAFTALIHETAHKHGRLDGLVNNAMSASYGKTILDLDIADWRRDFAVNVDATFIGTREAIRAMLPKGGGSIVNISAIAAIRVAPGLASYSASKAAMNQLTACAGLEFADQGIRVNCIMPGQIVTPNTQGIAAMRGEKTGLSIAETAPIKRVGETREIAEVVEFLLSDASSFMTGTAIPVDGGKVMQLFMPT
jgi:meso-butanediol dehydrogenase/(S,S)-butanediol dehydrogenase/diacetyl reductase